MESVRNLLLVAALVAQTAGAFADFRENLWFYADFDSPTVVDGAALEHEIPDEMRTEGRFGRGAMLGQYAAWDGKRIFRFEDADLVKRFPLRNGAFSCWYLATNSTSRTPATPGFCVGPYSRRHFGLNNGIEFSTGDAAKPSFRLKRVPARSDVWRHFAMTWTPTNIVAYLDGEEVGRCNGLTSRDYDNSLPDYAFWIGSFGDRLRVGDTKLDELAIFSRTLTADDVRHLAAAAKPLVAEPRVGLTPFAYPIFYRNQTNAALCARLFWPERARAKLKAKVRVRRADEECGWTEKTDELDVAAGWNDMMVKLPDLSQFPSGTYAYELRLDGFVRRGALLIRPRLERGQIKILSWGGFKPISHDFLETIGVNTVNYMHGRSAALERDALRRGFMLSARDVDYKCFLPYDLDETRIRERFRQNWRNLRGVWGWTMSLLNSEVLGSKTFPIWKCAESPRWRAFAERAIGTKLPENPDKIFNNEPHQVNWEALGLKAPLGVVETTDKNVELLKWLHRDGCPVLIGNDFHTREIRTMDSDNVTWSEPIIETTGLARHHDMVADWLYDYETSVNVKNLKDQYAWARAYAKPYMPTLSPGYWHCQRRGFWWDHPTAKDKRGKCVEYMVTQSADEMMIRTWLCFAAVPAHDLSLFALDGWERGAKAGETLQKDRCGIAESTSVCAPEDPIRYGRFLKETFLPTAELLRDMPNAHPDVALCPLLENRPMTRGWDVYTCVGSFGAMLAEGRGGVDYDIVVEPEFTLANLSRYRLVIVPYARVMTRAQHGILAALPSSTTLVFDEVCPTNVLPNAVHLKKDAFRAWYETRKADLVAARPARSDQDAADGEGSFTFCKEYKGARYVVVVNDKRDRGGLLQECYQTNAWYRPHGVPQTITTHLPFFAGGLIYEFGKGEKGISRTDDGCVLERTFAPSEGVVYCLYPKRLAPPKIWRTGGTHSAAPKLEIAIDDINGAPAPGRQIVEVTLTDADGRVRDESGRYVVENGAATITLRPMANESADEWKVRVRDLTTGLSACLSALKRQTQGTSPR